MIKWSRSYSRFSTRQLIPAVGLMVVLGTSVLNGDSLWTDGASSSLFTDRKANKVGDILTVIVQESNTTSKDQNKQTSKQSSMDASIGTFLYAPAASSLLTKGGKMPAMKMESKNDFSGGGSVKNSETIAARIAVRVVDVLPNHNLVIEGRRQTAFSGETQDIVLRGVVRSEDVTSGNTVVSTSIADATITFVSKGSVSDNSKKGWFGKVWDKVTPF